MKGQFYCLLLYALHYELKLFIISEESYEILQGMCSLCGFGEGVYIW